MIRYASTFEPYQKNLPAEGDIAAIVPHKPDNLFHITGHIHRSGRNCRMLYNPCFYKHLFEKGGAIASVQTHKVAQMPAGFQDLPHAVGVILMVSIRIER